MGAVFHTLSDLFGLAESVRSVGVSELRLFSAVGVELEYMIVDSKRQQAISCFWGAIDAQWDASLDASGEGKATMVW